MGGDDLGDESFLVEDISAEDDKEDEPVLKRRKREQTPEEILIETGRRLHNLDPADQAAFLNTATKHFALKETSIGESSSEGLLSNTVDSENKELIQEQWLIPKKSQDEGLKGEIRNVVSMKKLKHWKGKSPCVLIVCLSARRAVAILKEISGLRVRVSKIFPKAGSVEEQKENLQVPIAVGTPHRLRQLCASWESTLLVVLDAATSNKQFTVCTLPDTAPDCMAFLKESIAPELARRKTCRLAIF